MKATPVLAMKNFVVIVANVMMIVSAAVSKKNKKIKI